MGIPLHVQYVPELHGPICHMTHEYMLYMQSTHSVESTPVHASSLQTSSPGKNDSASGRRSPSISSLFDSGSSKRSIFKKIFGRKPSSTKQRSMTVSKIRSVQILSSAARLKIRKDCVSQYVVIKPLLTPPTATPPGC